jgi:hypothetical protein
LLIQGKAKWAKVTGKPVPGYENTFNHWSLDVYVDEDTVKRLKAEGINVKDKGEGPFVSFSRKEFNRDGKPNQPIRIVNHKGETLQDQNTVYNGPKIGNGSTVNINFQVYEYAKKKFSPVILSMQIWELIPYEGGEFPTRDDPEGNWEEDAA